MTETGELTIQEGGTSTRIAFLPENPHDGHTGAEVFGDYDLEVTCVHSLSQLVDEAESGAGCLIVVEEKLYSSEVARLVEHLQNQPSWSDLPVLVVTRADRSSEAAWRLSKRANVSLVERPIRIKNLVTVVRAALRDRQRQYEMYQSMANRDRFVAMVGHELRNPLTAISLAVNQLGGDVENQDAVEILRRQTQSLERIVDDLLEVSRISRGVITFDKERIDLTALIEQSTKAHVDSVRNAGLQLEVRGLETPLWVYGDRVRLEQVVNNLLNNAVRYTPEGGDIEVEVRQAQQCAVVSVRDTGIGISPDQLADVFDVFTQAHGDGADDKGGLGLGLSLAHSIVKQHDGTLEAHSEGKGEGSQFSMHLPLCEEKGKDDPTSSPVDDTGPDDSDADIGFDNGADVEAGLRLLIVEDIVDVRTTLGKMLRHRGYSVDDVASGRRALEAFEEGGYDAVLLDIGLPDCDSTELARRIRMRDESVVVIALTTFEREELDEPTHEVFDARLVKPVKLGALEAVLSPQNNSRPETR